MNIIYFSILFFLLGCGSKTQSTPELTTDIENVEEVKVSTENSIEEEDTLNLVKIEGVDVSFGYEIPIMRKSVFLNSLQATPYVYDKKILLNRSDEVLVLHGNLGGKKNTFQYFDLVNRQDFESLCPELSIIDLDKVECHSSEKNVFSTENNIYLSITKNEVLKMKSLPYTISNENGCEIITYQISNPENPILKEYNLPVYQMKFYFRDNVLVRYSFGFPPV